MPPRIRMIDFAKVVPLEAGRKLTHRSTWVKGNREDGFLVGLDALIQLWGEPLETLCGEDEVSRSESLATPEGAQEVPATAEGSVPPPVPQTPENSLVPPDAPPPTPQSSSASAGAADQR